MTIQRLHHTGIKHIVVKSGKDGCYCSGFQPDILKVAATKVEHVIDTTSAGDAFNAGFLAGYLNHLPIQQAAEMGHLLAGRVIQHKGAIIPKEYTQPITMTFLIMRNNDEKIIDRLRQLKIVPVISVSQAEDIIPLGEALYQNGLSVAEITFRSPAATEAISLLKTYSINVSWCWYSIN